MIRRIVSVIFLALGGWLLTGEFIVAFLDLEPGATDNLVLVAAVLVFVCVPLLLGAWVSPAERWRELGLTILIAAGAAAFGAISTVVVFTDPGAKGFMPPLPKFEFAPIIGVANLLIIGGIGWLLYRRPGGAKQSETDPGSSPG
jgi:hypothetical protein